MLLKKNIPFRYMIGKIRKELLLVMVYTIFIAVIYHNFHMTRMTIPLAVPMVMGTVISLLLGFRSNQAYDRWWEARIIWGAIVNDSRTLARQILTFTDDPYKSRETEQFTERFIRRQAGWCHSLSKALRDKDAMEGLDKYLLQAEVSRISRYSNTPNAILQLHGQDIIYAMQQGWINQYQHVEIDRTLSRLCDSMGKCERIKNTVFPATYSVYIHFAMNFFILLLPFALIQYFGFIVIPLIAGIAASFFLIEKMAIHLQDPFENQPTDTPMTAISNTIERDLNHMLNDYRIAEEKNGNGVSSSYYVM